MKIFVLNLLAIVVFAGMTTNMVAQATNTSATVSNTSAGAVLVVAMTLSQTAPMHFGSNVLTDATGGTVILASTGAARSYTGGVAASAATPVATNAAYNVTGTALETYAITLPSTTTVTHTTAVSGTRTMDITSMTARFSGALADAVTSTLSSTGTDSFTLGGTLTVQAAQVGGIYAGTFPVTVDYN